MAAYDLTLANYPEGDILSEALYKRGLALDRLGENQRAEMSLRLVIQDHPESNMVALAQQALRRLRPR